MSEPNTPPQDPYDQTPYGQTPYGQTPYGQVPQGQVPQGQGGAPLPYGAPPPPYGVSRMSSSEERTWASAAHWSAIVAAAIGLSFLGPLVVMLTKGNESPYVRRQAVESLNFQLSLLIYSLVAFVVGVVVTIVTFRLALLALFPLFFAVLIAAFVLTIVAAVKASRGEDFRYPLTLRLVS